MNLCKRLLTQSCMDSSFWIIHLYLIHQRSLAASNITDYCESGPIGGVRISRDLVQAGPLRWKYLSAGCHKRRKLHLELWFYQSDQHASLWSFPYGDFRSTARVCMYSACCAGLVRHSSDVLCLKTQAYIHMYIPRYAWWGVVLTSAERV